ncbi:MULTISPECIES: DUF6415 family natural product biosynthesis protein [Streptomyces]|uniref:DUF6415 family natural product biosynthesis protein n=1 Tax=Streptomyces TaxID=1883 RepID=UPI00292CB543|nr:DUF6415 family natural product biosynthesis protein [Streptomyces sp. NEAU-HV9]
MTAISPHAEMAPLDTVAMRGKAHDFIRAGDVLLRHGELKQHSTEFSQNLWQLIDQIGQHAARRPQEVVVIVAMAGVAEAQRRLGLIERPGLQGEHERVKKLACSVLALCDHYETLSGITMCLVCDKPIADGDETVPYDQLSPSGGATRSGRMHAACGNRARRSR